MARRHEYDDHSCHWEISGFTELLTAVCANCRRRGSVSLNPKATAWPANGAFARHLNQVYKDVDSPSFVNRDAER